jgi:hypothetical protein
MRGSPIRPSTTWPPSWSPSERPSVSRRPRRDGARPRPPRSRSAPARSRGHHLGGDGGVPQLVLRHSQRDPLKVDGRVSPAELRRQLDETDADWYSARIIPIHQSQAFFRASGPYGCGSKRAAATEARGRRAAPTFRYSSAIRVSDSAAVSQRSAPAGRGGSGSAMDVARRVAAIGMRVRRRRPVVIAAVDLVGGGAVADPGAALTTTGGPADGGPGRDHRDCAGNQGPRPGKPEVSGHGRGLGIERCVALRRSERADSSSRLCAVVCRDFRRLLSRFRSKRATRSRH